ncbi:MAG: preprotein translocase subunit YajC [Elusimicrobia bacterium]|nr:preprotein translocase subunit YajC [Elusimicrobiota bacterium]
MQPQANPIISLFPIAAIFLIFYFLLIRPQQKQQKAHQKMLEGLKKGDRILTTGGLYGAIVGLKGNDLEVRFSETVKLTVARSAVASLLSSEGDCAQTSAKTPSAIS